MLRTKKKIVRTPTRAAGGITDVERAAMAEHAALWIRRAFRTEPIVPEKIVPAIKQLYAVANLPEPRVIIVPSPIVMALAGGFAAGIWWLRENATGAATRAATDAATYAATSAATYAATYEATDAATRAATDAATGAATYAATDAATYAATNEATRAATRGAIRNATYSPSWQYDLALHFGGTGENAAFLMSCAAAWWRCYQGGNMWAGVESYITAARDILGLRLPAHAAYTAWEQCAIEGGFRIMSDKFCMVSDFPERILVDERNRPHCDDGPSHRWRDGWSIWHLHGVRVTEQIVMRPDTITVEQIRAENNAEVRRVMIDRYGEERYIIDSGMRPVAHDEQFGTLYVEAQESGTPIAKIRVINRSPEPDGTFKPYWLDINPAHYSGDAGRIPQAAVASTWRTADGALAFASWRDYSPLVET